MTRGQAKSTDNSEYLAFVRQSYLNRLKDNLPKNVLDKTTWLSPPAVLTEVQSLIYFTAKQHKLTFYFESVHVFVCKTSEILRKLHYRLMVRKYVRGLSPQKKAQVTHT